jgi:replicative DNA helicase
VEQQNDQATIYVETMGLLQPGSREASETAVIGCLILAGGENLGMCDVSVDDFHGPEHRAIYQTILNLKENGQPVDPAIIMQHTGIDAAPAMSRALNAIPTSAHLDFYLQRMKSFCAEAATYQLRQDTAASLRAGADPIEATKALESQIKEIECRYYDRRFDESMDFANAVHAAVESIWLGNAPTVIPATIPFLDSLLKGGFCGGDNMVLAARPSQGKTAFLLQILIELAKHGVPSVFFSIEMTKEQLAARILSYVSGLDATHAMKQPHLLTKEQREEFARYGGEAAEIAKHITLFTSGINLSLIRRKTKDAVLRGAKLVALDYVQLMDGEQSAKNQNRNSEVEVVSRAWKNMLKDLNIPGIMLSQLSRRAEQEKRRPVMSDLRDSGAIEQDADIIWFLHREKINTNDQRLTAPERTALLQEKGRQIGRGGKMLIFDGRKQRFFEVETEANE